MSGPYNKKSQLSYSKCIQTCYQFAAGLFHISVFQILAHNARFAEGKETYLQEANKFADQTTVFLRETLGEPVASVHFSIGHAFLLSNIFLIAINQNGG